MTTATNTRFKGFYLLDSNISNGEICAQLNKATELTLTHINPNGAFPVSFCIDGKEVGRRIDQHTMEILQSEINLLDGMMAIAEAIPSYPSRSCHRCG